MNPLMVSDGKSALMAFGIGFVVAALITVLMHYLGGSLTTLGNKVAGLS